MRKTGLYALFAVALAAVIVAVAISSDGGGGVSDPRIGRPVLAGLAARLGDVGRLTIVHGDATTTMLRRNGDWVVEQKNFYAADPAKMNRILLGLAALRYAEPKTAKPSLYARLDVEDPGKKGEDAQLLTLSDSKGQLLGEMIFGKQRYDIFGGGNDGIYVRKPGEAQSWLAVGSLVLPTSTLDWIDRRIAMIGDDRIVSARFVAPDNSVVEVDRAKAGAPLALKGGIPKGQKLKSDDALNDLARGLNYFSLDDVEPATSVPFPDKGISQAIYTTADGLTITVSMVERDEIAKEDGKDTTKKKYWVKILASGTGKARKEASELNKHLVPWAFAVPDYKANIFKTRMADLVEPEKSS